jgi:hypothetical protein
MGLRKNMKLILSDIRNHGFVNRKTKKYDLITCCEVLQQMKREEVEMILEKIKHAIKKGGYVYIRLCSDIERKLPDGRLIMFDSEACYSSNEAIALLLEKFKGWNIIRCFPFRIERRWLIPRAINSLSYYKEYIRKEMCIKFLASKT